MNPLDKIELTMSAGQVLLVIGLPDEILTMKYIGGDYRKEFWYYQISENEKLEISFISGAVVGIGMNRTGQLTINHSENSLFKEKPVLDVKRKILDLARTK